MPFPIAAGLAIAGGASLVGGIGNFLANKSAADRAEMLYEKGFREWMALNIPDPKEQELALEQFVVEGILTPEFEQAIEADPSEFEHIVTSSSHKAAQNRALAELEDIGRNGGMRLQDKAALQEAMSATNTQERSNREAIRADAARRGAGGSGFSLASQLASQQSGADRNARSSLSAAAAANDRALQAIMGAGELAGKYRTQEFGEKAQKASAADRINLFNTQNSQDVRRRNTGVRNAASERNLAQRQMTSDKNVALRNYQQEHNKGLAQQKFENEARRKAGATGQLSGQAGVALKQGENAGNFWSNIGTAGTKVGTALALDDYDTPTRKRKKLLPEEI